MKVQEMLKRKMECADSFDKTGEGADCHKCRLCDPAKLKSKIEEPQGLFLEGAEVSLIINPCLLLDELASKIKA